MEGCCTVVSARKAKYTPKTWPVAHVQLRFGCILYVPIIRFEKITDVFFILEEMAISYLLACLLFVYNE